ncbi:transporter substrate-binding domain-containing protein [Nocardia sp. NPDC058666]|uniref:glutamate ABC transporter substrate-binding protein n=1 Tax=unclassified Nocardia TaxID=2637762 RepID=UPI003651B809
MRRLLLIALMPLVLVAGCADAPEPSTIPATAISPPLPGSAPVTQVPVVQGPTDCDAEATVAPGVQPRPGAMPPGSSMAAIVANGRVRIGVDQHNYMFGFRNPTTGRLEGFDIDLAREIARDLFGDPDRIELVPITAADRISWLKDKKVDIVVHAFSITCGRRNDIDFSSTYFRTGQRIAVPRNSGMRAAEDLAGKRVCVAHGATSAARLLALVPPPSVLGVNTWTDCLVALQQGTVDAISSDESIVAGLVAQDRNLEVVGPPLGSEAYGVGVPKGREDLVRFVNGVLDRTRTDGTWQRLYAQHLAPLGPSPGPPAARYVR